MRPGRCLLGVCVLVMSIAAACSNDTDDRSPLVDPPASRFAPGGAELPAWLEPHPTETFEVSSEVFGYLGPFADPAQGEAFAREQGYQDGYRAQFHPDGQLAGVASGDQFYLTVETYLLASDESAETVYALFEDRYGETEGSQGASADQLGNRSSAWQFAEGTVGDTEIEATYYGFIFQRGNIVGVVQIYGAADGISAGTARDVALIMDERILGEREAVPPTPAGSDTPGGGELPGMDDDAPLPGQGGE